MGCERAAGPISLPFEYLTGDTALGSVSKDDCKVESGNAPLVSKIRDTLRQSGKVFITCTNGTRKLSEVKAAWGTGSSL